jgi:histidinol-phosphate aminotransferase
MSRFFSSKYKKLTPYVPGEQPKDMRYIKLNTNESPFPPSPAVVEAAAAAARHGELYSDPTCSSIRQALADRYGTDVDEVMAVNGSDEALNFAFMAFCDAEHPAAFPDVTYGFYPVFAAVNGVPYREIPLNPDFTLDPEDYTGTGETLFLANPNAPTGIALPVSVIEEIVRSNPDRVVVVDEAYVDFGAESSVPLIRRYGNLLVIGTFSKSRSLAGARLGFAFGCRDLIRDLETLRNSTNPYNVNRMTMAAGVASLAEDGLNEEHSRIIRRTREKTAAALKELGFEMTDSKANFLFARHPSLDGGELYTNLKSRGILVRHWDGERIRQYNRITVGTEEQMDALVASVRDILEEAQ